MRPDNLVFALVTLPLLGAAFSFCAKAFLSGRPAKALEYLGAIIGLVLPWAVLAYTLPLVLSGQVVEGVVGNWSQAVGIMYRFDGLAWLVNCLGFAIAGAAWLYSLGAGPHGPAFTAVFLIQTAALAATAMTADLFNLFVCLEVMGLASYVLVASSEKPGAFLAAFSYLMVSATAMVFFLLGIYGLYRLTGHLSYRGIALALAALPNLGGVPALVSLSLIVAAVAMRVAVMPLYGWLPDAHALAPHAISAVLSGVLIKTPLFALSRVLLLLPAGAQAGQLMGYAGALTALVAVIIALSQTDAKRLLAYHSVSQIGYVVAAWGAAIYVGQTSRLGLGLMTAAFLHALYHAMFKGLLFLTVGTTTDQAGERDVYRLRNGAAILRRGGERLPLTVICFAIGALAISAIPPLNGYASKTALSYALKGSWQYGLLFAAGIGTMASFMKLSRIYWPAGASTAVLPTDDERPRRVPRPVKLAQALLGGLCLLSGLAAPLIHRYVVKLLASGAGAASGVSTANGLHAAGLDGAAGELLDLASLSLYEVAAQVPGPSLYTLDNLLKTAWIILGGWLVFKLASGRIGSRVLTLIRDRPRDFQGLFLSFALGTAGLVAWLLYLG